MIYVLAGNYRQFEHYLRENQIPRNEARYISGVDTLRGVGEAVVVRTGSWVERPDIPEIERALRVIWANELGLL